MLNIREARIGDYDAVETMFENVQNLHVMLRTDIYKDVDVVISFDEMKEGILNHNIYVAEIDKNIAGIVFFKILHIDNVHQIKRNVLYVECLVVEPDYRRKGVGKSLLDFIKKKKNELSLDGIELQVNAKNINAYDMYRKYGFSEKSINLELL